jgi:site-specific recombinase XerD
MEVGRARKEYIRWLLTTKDLSPHTIRAYDGDIAAFEQHLGTTSQVDQIDRAALVAFVEKQRGKLSPRSIKRRASALRGFCKWLRTSHHLHIDPWVEVRLQIGRPRKLPRVLSTPDLDRLLHFLRRAAGLEGASAPTLERPHETVTLLAVSLMVTTGMRVHEVVSLRCRDIDLPSRSVRLLGKGRRERQVFLTNDWIADLTGVFLESRETLALQHPYLLFNLHHDPLTTSSMRSRLAKAARAANIDERVTPHMLRHTAATQLIEAGVDIRYIQRLLGHSSLSTTEIYTHVSDRALRRVVSDADVLGRVTEAR